MTAYILATIWLLSNLVALQIAKQRNVKTGLALGAMGALLGPLAIPIALCSNPAPTGRK